MDDLLFNDLMEVFKAIDKDRVKDCDNCDASRNPRCLVCDDFYFHKPNCSLKLTHDRLIKYKQETDNDKKGNKNLIDFGINPANC